MKRGAVLVSAVLITIGWMCMGESLGGQFRVDLTIDPLAADFSNAISLVGTLRVDYEIGDWTFGSTTTIDETGWVNQVLTGSGKFGVMVLGSTLDMDPAGGFDSWTSTCEVSIAGVQYVYRFTLAPDDLAMSIRASADSDPLSVGVTIDLGDTGAQPGCDLLFQGATVDIGFPFCCTQVASSVEFECTGFESATFGVSGISVPTLPWLTLAASLQFTLDEKKLTIAPSISYGTTVCFDLYFDTVEDSTATYPGDTLVFNTIEVVGIGLECKIGDVSFAAVSYWGDSGKPSPLTGDYWEAYRISTTTDGSCCGPFGFECTVFFLEGSGTLFDLAFLQVELSMEVGTQFMATVGIDLDLAGAGFTELRAGFVVDF